MFSNAWCQITAQLHYNTLWKAVKTSIWKYDTGKSLPMDFPRNCALTHYDFLDFSTGSDRSGSHNVI